MNIIKTKLFERYFIPRDVSQSKERTRIKLLKRIINEYEVLSHCFFYLLLLSGHRTSYWPTERAEVSKRKKVSDENIAVSWEKAAEVFLRWNVSFVKFLKEECSLIRNLCNTIKVHPRTLNNIFTETNVTIIWENNRMWQEENRGSMILNYYHTENLLYWFQTTIELMSCNISKIKY